MPSLRKRSFIPFESISSDLQWSLVKETLACDLSPDIKSENSNIMMKRKIAVTNFWWDFTEPVREAYRKDEELFVKECSDMMTGNGF